MGPATMDAEDADLALENARASRAALDADVNLAYSSKLDFKSKELEQAGATGAEKRARAQAIRQCRVVRPMTMTHPCINMTHPYRLYVMMMLLLAHVVGVDARCGGPPSTINGNNCIGGCSLQGSPLRPLSDRGDRSCCQATRDYYATNPGVHPLRGCQFSMVGNPAWPHDIGGSSFSGNKATQSFAQCTAHGLGVCYFFNCDQCPPLTLNPTTSVPTASPTPPPPPTPPTSTPTSPTEHCCESVFETNNVGEGHHTLCDGCGGTYRIVARGAAGGYGEHGELYSSRGGYGASVTVEHTLESNTEIVIAVGETSQYFGGGGTFVRIEGAATPLVVAGGGGGSGYSAGDNQPDNSGRDAETARSDEYPGSDGKFLDPGNSAVICPPGSGGSNGTAGTAGKATGGGGWEDYLASASSVRIGGGGEMNMLPGTTCNGQSRNGGNGGGGSGYSGGGGGGNYGNNVDGGGAGSSWPMQGSELLVVFGLNDAGDGAGAVEIFRCAAPPSTTRCTDVENYTDMDCACCQHPCWDRTDDVAGGNFTDHTSVERRFGRKHCADGPYGCATNSAVSVRRTDVPGRVHLRRHQRMADPSIWSMLGGI